MYVSGMRAPFSKYPPGLPSLRDLALSVRLRCRDCRDLFVAQRIQRIDFSRAPGWCPARQQPDGDE